MASTWAPSGLAAAGLGGPGTPPPLARCPPALRVSRAARGAGRRAGSHLSFGPAFPDSFPKAGQAWEPGLRSAATGLHPCTPVSSIFLVPVTPGSLQSLTIPSSLVCSLQTFWGSPLPPLLTHFFL